MFMGPRNWFQGMNSASLCSLAGRYENPIPPRCLAPIDFLKIPALVLLRLSIAGNTKYVYIKCTTVNVPSSELDWDPPNPSLASECALPPEPGGEGGAHSPADEVLGESQFRRLEKSLALCLLYGWKSWNLEWRERGCRLRIWTLRDITGFSKFLANETLKRRACIDLFRQFSFDHPAVEISFSWLSALFAGPACLIFGWKIEGRAAKVLW